MTTLLVPLDYSDQAMAALPLANQIAREQKADVVVLAVGNNVEASEQEDELKAKESRLLSRAMDELPGISVRSRSAASNNAAAAIIEAAEEVRADIVVMAAEAREGRSLVAREDVAQELRDAGLQVSVVPYKEEPRIT